MNVTTNSTQYLVRAVAASFNLRKCHDDALAPAFIIDAMSCLDAPEWTPTGGAVRESNGAVCHPCNATR